MPSFFCFNSNRNKISCELPIAEFKLIKFEYEYPILRLLEIWIPDKKEMLK